MWLETLAKVISDMKSITESLPNIDDIKELNKTELRLHNIFQEYYGVLGNATREVKKVIHAQRLVIKRNEVEKRAIEQEKAMERLIEETPAQEVVDASKLSDDVIAMDLNGNIVTEAPELTEEQKKELEKIKKEVKAEKNPAKKKTTKKKTTKKKVEK